MEEFSPELNAAITDAALELIPELVGQEREYGKLLNEIQYRFGLSHSCSKRVVSRILSRVEHGWNDVEQGEPEVISFGDRM